MCVFMFQTIHVFVPAGKDNILPELLSMQLPSRQMRSAVTPEAVFATYKELLRARVAKLTHKDVIKNLAKDPKKEELNRVNTVLQALRKDVEALQDHLERMRLGEPVELPKIDGNYKVPNTGSQVWQFHNCT